MRRRPGQVRLEVALVSYLSYGLAAGEHEEHVFTPQDVGVWREDQSAAAAAAGRRP